MRRSFRVCVFALLLLWSISAFALTTKSLDGGLTVSEVVGLLTGPGAQISNVRIIGSNLAIGSFEAGEALGIGSGIVLSSGNVAGVVGPNTSGGAGAGLGTAGHPALTALVTPFETHDAAVIEFDVITETPTFAIRYVFASEEYREWVGSEFNDVFGFFVDGGNIALTPGTADPVTINTINHLSNQGLYRDNATGTATQFDGYTVPLLAVAVVEPGIPHRIRIAVADASDSVLDSAVFIARGGISGSAIAPIIIPDDPSIEAIAGPEGVTVRLPIFYAFLNNPPAITASGVPGATVTFSPLYQLADGRMFTDMKLVLGSDSISGSHILTIRTALGGSESFATIVVVVDCKSPALLGTNQPQSQSVNRGTSATLKVQPDGSGPFTYQWYNGFSGMTRSPVLGATTAELRTTAVTELMPFWVRVTNACGTYDSLTAFAIPK